MNMKSAIRSEHLNLERIENMKLKFNCDELN